MTTITDAVSDLKASISADGFDETIVAEIAADHSLHPKLLERKFIEATGKQPCDYVERAVEINFSKIYDKMRKRQADKGARLGGRLTFDSLTPKEQDLAKAEIARNLSKRNGPDLYWTTK